MFGRSIMGLILLSASGMVIAEGSCTDVVTDTLAEMRAGAGDQWNDDMERFARAAAGAACVKAMSGRYDALKVDESLQSEAVAAKSGTRSTSATAGESKENDSWSFGGLTFKSMSGSPGKKPYERQRQQSKDVADQNVEGEPQPD